MEEVDWMLKAEMTDEQVLDKITKVFQLHSYEAINTDQISTETGISTTELRQRFPEGKEQMVVAILERSDIHFNAHILSPLFSKKNLTQRIIDMAERVKSYYQNGFGTSLLETLSIGNSPDEYKSHVSRSFTTWCNALVEVARESGFSNNEAQHRAEQALVSIEGSLVYARITGNNKPFHNCLENLPCLLTGVSC